jgi:hypothetical protein
MKASKEYRHWINRIRSRLAKQHGVKNGVIPCRAMDHPIYELHLVNNEKRSKNRRVNRLFVVPPAT